MKISDREPRVNSRDAFLWSQDRMADGIVVNRYGKVSPIMNISIRHPKIMTMKSRVAKSSSRDSNE